MTSTICVIIAALLIGWSAGRLLFFPLGVFMPWRLTLSIWFLPARVFLRWFSLLLLFPFILITFLCGILPIQAATSITDNMNAFTEGGNIHTASISADGQFIVYASDVLGLTHKDNVSDIFLYEVSSGQKTLISTGVNGNGSNGTSGKPAISADGQYIVFASAASNLVSGDQNNTVDIFLYQRDTETIERLVALEGDSSAALGDWNPWPTQIDLSGDGRFIVFDTMADVSSGPVGSGQSGIFVYDRASQVVKRVTMLNDSLHGLSHAVISQDGRYIAFESQESNSMLEASDAFTQVFLYDMERKESTQLSVNNKGVIANGASFRPKISDDGRYVSFYSEASNLADTAVSMHNHPADISGIYIYDRLAQKVQLATVTGYEWPDQPVNVAFDMSEDGRFIVFSSKARNLTNYWEGLCVDRRLDDECFWGGTNNVFRYDSVLDHMDLISIDNVGFPLQNNSVEPSISKDGTHVVFASEAQEDTDLDASRSLHLIVPPIVSALTLISPSDDLFEEYPTYTWSADDDAVAYRLLTDEAPISNWLSSEDLGCDINHLCSVTPLAVLDYGLQSIFIQSVTAQGVFSPLASPQYVNKRPETPQAEALSVLMGDKLTLRWNRISAATQYRVLVQDKNTRETIVNEIVGDATAYTLSTQLDPSGEYHWKVRVQSPEGVYSSWADISFKIAIDAPEPAFPVGSVASLAPGFVWNVVEGASQYRILIQDIDTGEIINKVLKQGYSYTHSAPFEPNHSYRWKVRTQIPQGEYSEWAYFKILDGEVSDGEHTVTLKWTEPEHRVDGSPLGDIGISHYIVEYQREHADQLHTVFVASEKLQLVLDDLSEGYYQFMIKAVDQEGLASSSSNKVTVNVPLSAGQ